MPTGSALELQRYKIKGIGAFAKEMEEKGLGKPKVSLQFQLNVYGVTELVKAEATVEETYTVEEEVEIEEEEETNSTEAKTEETSEEESEEAAEETAEGNETKTEEEPKKKKTKMVEKVRLV